MIKSSFYRARSWLVDESMLILLILSVFLYFFSYLTNVLGPPIRADGEGYYAYLPAIVIDADPSFRSLALRHFNGMIPGYTGLAIVTEDGCYLNKYGIGPALLTLPFFLWAHFFTWVMQSPPGSPDWFALNYPMDGYSIFYQHAAGLSALLYGLMGLLLIRRFLLKYFSPGTVAVSTYACFLGTNIWYYIAGDGFGNHSFSLFLYALLIHVVHDWHEQPTRWKNSILLGLVIGLIGLTRLPNIAVGIVFLFYGLGTRRSVKEQSHLFYLHKSKLLAAFFVALLTLNIQSTFNYVGVGEFILNGYSAKGRGEGFNFLNPEILNVLFSMKRGWLFWSPLVGLGFIGIYILYRDKSPWALGLAAALLAKLYVVSSWHMWWYGGGFGHRAFVEELVFIIFGLCAVISQTGTRWRTIFVYSFIIGAVLWTMFWMKLFYTKELSIYGIDWPSFFDVFYCRLKG